MRAEVHGVWGGKGWTVHLYTDTTPNRALPIRRRPVGIRLRTADGDPFHPTHEAAMDAAREAVGLSTPAEHREAP